MIPDIAIGAIGAAIIGALISLVGLIVSKESKVSEFRQAWIDALRSELSSYLSNVSAVVDARTVTFKDARERFEKLQPYYSKLNEAYYLIAFRLNPSEQGSKKIKSCMVAISKLIAGRDDIDAAEMERLKVEFIGCSNTLLKDEWKIVKKGEPVFNATKWALTIVASILVVVILVLLVRDARSVGGAKAQGSAVISRSAEDKSNAAPTRLVPVPMKDGRGLTPTHLPQAVASPHLDRR